MTKDEIIKSVTTHIEKIDVVGLVTEFGNYIHGKTIRNQKFLEKIKSFMTTATKTTHPP